MVSGWPASLVDSAQREQDGRDTNTEPEVPAGAGLRCQWYPRRELQADCAS